MNLEIIAASRGTLQVEDTRALRLVWALAIGEHPWEGPDPRALPELPPTVRELHDIPRAVTILSSDGRFDGPDERDFWRPDVQIVDSAAVWRPLELGTLPEGRTKGARFLRVAPHARHRDETEISWDTGSDAPSRFIGRCLVAAAGTQSLSHLVGVLALRRIDNSRPFSCPVGGAL